MRTYADGSALIRALSTDPEAASWLRWSDQHAHDLLTSPLGLSELKRAAQGLDVVARAKAHEIARSIEVVRFFDQALKPAAMASAVLDPFRAMHLGIAVAHPEVGTLATYDPLLARVAAIHDVDVVTPGRPPGWWDTEAGGSHDAGPPPGARPAGDVEAITGVGRRVDPGTMGAAARRHGRRGEGWLSGRKRRS
jgi:uncharacterized protein